MFRFHLFPGLGISCLLVPALRKSVLLAFLQGCELIPKIPLFLQFWQNVNVYHLSFSEGRAVMHPVHIIHRLQISSVYGVWLFETLRLRQAPTSAIAIGFGNMPQLENPYISAVDTPMLGSIIIIIVKGFFCNLIWFKMCQCLQARLC